MELIGSFGNLREGSHTGRRTSCWLKSCRYILQWYQWTPISQQGWSP